jgi:hypothetical protein
MAHDPTLVKERREAGVPAAQVVDPHRRVDQNQSMLRA